MDATNAAKPNQGRRTTVINPTDLRLFTRSPMNRMADDGWRVLGARSRWQMADGRGI